MSPDFSLTDKTTWIAILTVIATAASYVFHTDLSAYVPAAATLAAGIVVSVIALAKHHYAAALSSAGTAVAATAAVPVAGESAAFAAKFRQLSLRLEAAITALETPQTAPAPPVGPAGPTVATPVPPAPQAAPQAPHSVA